MTTTETLTAFIEGQLRDQGDDVDLAPDDDLVLLGLDSIAYVRLLAFIDDRFGLRVPDVDVTIEHFGSVAGITAYLQRRGIDASDGRASGGTDG